MDYNIHVSFLSVLHKLFEGKFRALWLLNSQLFSLVDLKLCLSTIWCLAGTETYCQFIRHFAGNKSLGLMFI